MHVNGSIAVVTGANRGIGRALVEALLAGGASVVYATARRPETVEDLVARDHRVRPLRLDVTDPEQVTRAARVASDATLLINNGGSLGFADPLTGDLATIEVDLRTNFIGTLSATRAFVPVIERNGGGAIVTMLSLVVFGAVPAMSGYSAAKAAAASATQALRAQLLDRKISVHGVFPGAVDTDMIRGMAMPKATPSSVATAILDGVEAGAENIFPDPMAQAGHQAWRADPAAFERRMGSM
ncbi:SDR family NAD(P)-dependent oxidoreductase [Actinoplanes oblitus]|uniref:SDR family NAD(P)-dependent oxidoreductase n=1 Tax=Actinoplanes oblitus TaxID=3040509 RepID=A0ABY8WTB0_9ACTN|nr:SDR family NAD(P)-dependent oxidoreductase [Actinoplanes oblitus]WIM99045.1 SDR family NAD(P)-dependent oxidoreductase [Actinoplanes oblitus]